MSELAHYADSRAGVALPATVETTLYADPTGGRLVAWASAAMAANQLARALCTTSFVPRVKDRTGQMVPISEGDATAQILMGDELGLSPLASLRSLFVVHGTPSMYTRTMVALVQSHGHEVWTEATSDASVTVCGRRRGSENVERSTWTTARAQKAKYTGNPKYQTNPQEMLYAKAAGEVCRKIAADVLAGIPASMEELDLSEPSATVTVTRAPAPATKAQRKPVTPTPEPQEPPLEPAAPEPTPEADELRTEAQSRAMFAMSREKFATPEEFRAWLAQYHEGSTKDMSRATAKRVLDALDALPIDADVIDTDTGEVQ